MESVPGIEITVKSDDQRRYNRQDRQSPVAPLEAIPASNRFPLLDRPLRKLFMFGSPPATHLHRRDKNCSGIVRFFYGGFDLLSEPSVMFRFILPSFNPLPG
jgi:hypothetical protein